MALSVVLAFQDSFVKGLTHIVLTVGFENEDGFFFFFLVVMTYDS